MQPIETELDAAAEPVLRDKQEPVDVIYDNSTQYGCYEEQRPQSACDDEHSHQDNTDEDAVSNTLSDTL